jgi:hypothetical protein
LREVIGGFGTEPPARMCALTSRMDAREGAVSLRRVRGIIPREMRRLSALALRFASASAFALACGCANNPERLPELDRRFYYNLETPEEQKAFLDLDDDDRQTFLDDHGLWDKWTSLPDAQRKRALAGDVALGDAEFAAFMAWGPPADTMLRDRDGRDVRVHTFIRCTSGPKAGRYVRSNLDCDGTSAETQVSVQAGVIAEIEYPH